LSAEKDCYDIAEEDVYSFSAWVEVEGQESRMFKTSEELANLKEGWIASELGKVCQICLIAVSLAKLC
jgi:hypothetical protein